MEAIVNGARIKLVAVEFTAPPSLLALTVWFSVARFPRPGLLSWQTLARNLFHQVAETIQFPASWDVRVMRMPVNFLTMGVVNAVLAE